VVGGIRQGDVECEWQQSVRQSCGNKEVDSIDDLNLTKNSQCLWTVGASRFGCGRFISALLAITEDSRYKKKMPSVTWSIITIQQCQLALFYYRWKRWGRDPQSCHACRSIRVQILQDFADLELKLLRRVIPAAGCSPETCGSY